MKLNEFIAMAAENNICRRVLRAAFGNYKRVSVCTDGDWGWEEQLKDEKSAWEYLQNFTRARIYLENGSKVEGWVDLYFGNGLDVIVDYAATGSVQKSLQPVLDRANEYELNPNLIMEDAIIDRCFADPDFRREFSARIDCVPR